MPYYQILKQRRINLNLTIDDVALQTRLRPEYVRAIEENNLDIFSDDFSYVRYFVHGYCDAIGVNWNIIKDEVDANIHAYAAARDQAMYNAQVKMLQSMPAVKTTRKNVRQTRKKRKKNNLASSAGKISRSLSWGNQNKLSRLVLICAICVVGGLALISYIGQHQAAGSLEAQKLAREQELKEQEETTQRLAEDLKNRKGGNSDTVTAPAALSITRTGQNGVYEISGFTENNPVIQLAITPSETQQITILWNDVPAYSSKVKDTFTYDLNAGSDGTVTITFANPNTPGVIKIDGTELPADSIEPQSDGTVQIQLKIHYGQSAADGSSSQVADPSTQNETASQGDVQTDVQAEQPYVEEPVYSDDGSGYYEEIPDSYYPEVPDYTETPDQTYVDPGIYDTGDGGYGEEGVSDQLVPVDENGLPIQ